MEREAVTAETVAPTCYLALMFDLPLLQIGQVETVADEFYDCLRGIDTSRIVAIGARLAEVFVLEELARHPPPTAYVHVRPSSEAKPSSFPSV